MASSSAPGMPSTDAVLHQARAQLQAQQLEQLVQSIADKSFTKCVTKPGKSLSSSEQNCIAKTMDRYLDAMSIVFSTLNNKASAST